MRRSILAGFLLVASFAAGGSLGYQLAYVPPSDQDEWRFALDRRALAAQPVVPDPEAETSGDWSWAPEIEKPLNILIMGTDVTRRQKGEAVPTLDGNSDTIILVRIDPLSGQVWGISIPRDTRVQIPRRGTYKINAANAMGGPRLAAQTVADYLQVPIDHYIRLNTKGVAQLIDAIGGVDLYIPKAMHYRDRTGGLNIRFEKGEQHLNGQQAHDYLRFRHDELGDIGRVQRQQSLLLALTEQTLTPTTLFKIPEILRVLDQNIQSDLSHLQWIQLARFGASFDRTQLKLTMLPGHSQTIDGLSYWLGEPDAIAPMLSQYRGELPDPMATAPSLRVAIIATQANGKQVSPLLDQLRVAGYRPVYLGKQLSSGLNWDEHATTQVIATRGDSDAARRIATLVGTDRIVTASTGDLQSDVTLILGQDWTPTAAQ